MFPALFSRFALQPPLMLLLMPLMPLLAAGTLALAVLPARAAPSGTSLVERALSCSDASDCPYFPEAYKDDRAFRTAFLVELKKADIRRPRWVPNGVTTPLRPVDVEGEVRLMSSVCEPHNCGHYFLVLYDPVRGAVTGVYLGRDSSGALQTRYFGRPNLAEMAVLKNNQ